MQRLVREQRLGFVATVSPDGTPNLSPKGTTTVSDAEHLVFAEMASPETVANLRRNPGVEVNVVDMALRKGYRFKGTAEVLTEGARGGRPRALAPVRRALGDRARPPLGRAAGRTPLGLPGIAAKLGESMAPTQDALYPRVDLELSWSERELPQRERTRHVHGLHPYLGKFVPQLVEALLARYLPPRGRVLDPFAGSGTTLVQALESGHDAAGADVAAFNCLLMRVKTARYDLCSLERDVRDALARFERGEGEAEAPTGYLRTWFARRSAGELLRFRSLAGEYRHADVLRVVLARAARSARLTTHFDLDFPRAAQRAPYWCHKHRRACRPVERADHFLRRYALDTLVRIRQFQRARAAGCEARVLHGDARALDVGGRFDGVVTSPPYPGLIDYHEQHRYAYELLGLDELRAAEIGSARRGTGREALAGYVDDVASVLATAREHLRPDARVVVVVADQRGLYPDVLARAGLVLEERLRRHVNRRTGRRAGEFFEDVLVARAA